MAGGRCREGRRGAECLEESWKIWGKVLSHSRVDRQQLERVDRDENLSDVCVNDVLLEPDAEIVEDGLLGQVVQVDHVLDRLKTLRGEKEEGGGVR